MKNREYKICKRCVMDTSDVNIVFDDDGICNHCKSHYVKVKQKIPDPSRVEAELNGIVEQIKERGQDQEYDCVLGISGGVDSSYLALKAKELGLKPLAVHLDNGWNSEKAVKNIEDIMKFLDIDLYTHVIDWEEFRDLQRAFFKAHVIDIEMLTDHAIGAVLYKLARQNKIHYILSGANAKTESIMPSGWIHKKSDLKNIRAIHKRHGRIKLKTFPMLNVRGKKLYRLFFGIEMVRILDYINYSKTKAIEELKDKVGWRYYGGKHYESLFTKFYQAHILPEKFKIDKRRVHLSDLICAGEISREDAMEELEKPLYDPDELRDHKLYVTKKLGMTLEEFDDYIKAPPVSHFKYRSDRDFIRFLSKVKHTIMD